MPDLLDPADSLDRVRVWIMAKTSLEAALCDQSGGYDRFSRFDPSDLLEAEKNSVVRLALSVVDERMSYEDVFADPAHAKGFFRLNLGPRKTEVFAALFLTNAHAKIAYEELFRGTINEVSVYPRVVAQRALELNSSAVIFAHNHPPGGCKPSRTDESITRQLKDALELLNIRVLDHIIVGQGEAVSMGELGMV